MCATEGDKAGKLCELGRVGKPAIKVLRLKQMLERLGVGRSTIYDRMNPNSPRYDPSFPLPIRLSGGGGGWGAVGWIESDICRWIDARVAAGWGKNSRIKGRSSPCHSERSEEAVIVRRDGQ